MARGTPCHGITGILVNPVLIQCLFLRFVRITHAWGVYACWDQKHRKSKGSWCGRQQASSHQLEGLAERCKLPCRSGTKAGRSRVWMNEWMKLQWFRVRSSRFCLTHNGFWALYTVSRKKETKMFSAISPTKLGQLWWNLAHSFLNKFAATWCKRFPPHLNNVSTLRCETWNAHRARATIALLDRETPEFIPPQLWSPNSQDLNLVDNSMWKIL